MYRPSPRGVGAVPSPLNPFYSRSPENSPYRPLGSASSSPTHSSPYSSPRKDGSFPASPYTPPYADAQRGVGTPYNGRSIHTVSPWGSQRAGTGWTRQSGTPSTEVTLGVLSRSLSAPRSRGGKQSDLVSTPMRPETPLQSVDRTPQTPLRWEHPAMKEVTAKRAKNGFTNLDRRRLLWNTIALITLLATYVFGWYSSFKKFVPGYYPSIFMQGAFFGAFLLTGLNVIFLLIKYFKPTPNFAEYALTPAQRRMLGLDPNVPTSPDAQKRYADVVKPQLEARTSPRPPQTSSIQKQGQVGQKSSPYTTPSAESRSSRPVASSPVSPLAKYMLSTSPARMGAEPIRDRRALENMLETADQPGIHEADMMHHEDTFGYIGYGSTAASPLVGLTPSTPSVPKFRPASKASTPAKVQERIEDGLVVKEPAKTLEEWNVGHYIEDWTETMRTWLATKVVKPLAQRIVETDAKFSEMGLEHLQCGVATMQAGMIAANMAAMAAITASTNQAPSSFGAPSTSLFNQPAGATTSLFGSKPAGASMFSTPASQPQAKPQTLYELSQRYKNEALVQERIKLENHLTSSDFSCREYVAERIKTLARGNNLANYQWNGGAPLDGKPWSHDWLPTDAQIVMHLFCRYMDELMPGENFATYGNFPFSSKYFVPIGSKPAVTKSIQIRHYMKWPPHYHVVVEGTVYDVYSGRNNVFHTLCLFAYYIKMEASGYIGLLNVGGKAIELTAVVPGGPSTGRFSDSHRRSLRKSPAKGGANEGAMPATPASTPGSRPGGLVGSR